MRCSHVAVDDPSFPPPVSGFVRVGAETLGVTFPDRLDISGHYGATCARAARSTYALRFLRPHGLQGENLWQVCRATTVSYLTYAAPAWWDYTSRQFRTAASVCVEQIDETWFPP